MYKISNSNKLIYLHNSVHNPYSIPLVELLPVHTFSSYNLSPSALI